MKQNLINIISRCNSTEKKREWILDLANNSNVECSESECDGCPIRIDCLSVLQPETIDAEMAEIATSFLTPECHECIGHNGTVDMSTCFNCSAFEEYVTNK